MLNATIGAGGAAGQLIVNTTHPSRAFLKANTAGNAWNMTQPLVPVTFPWTGVPVEVDTWANGDTYAVYTLLNVFVIDFKPTQVDVPSTFTENRIPLSAPCATLRER